MNKGICFMIKRVEKEMPYERIIPMGAAIGIHIGPKACGLVYIAKKR